MNVKWQRVHPEERFWASITIGPGCWEWLGPGDRYGAMAVYGKQVLAHRYAYELLVAPIPPGLEIDHLCRNQRCVRPEHLEPVTHAENMRRGAPFRRRGEIFSRNCCFRCGVEALGGVCSIHLAEIWVKARE